MPAESKTRDELHARLGYQRLNRAWAKLEIFFGLSAAGLGMLLGGWSVARPAVELLWSGAALLLFVLGWYLALAGHRSHLYQSMNHGTALLIEEMHRSTRKETLPPNGREV